MRLLLLLPALIAAAACAHRAPPAPPRPTVQFVPVPEAEAAGVKNPHAYGSGSLCQRCHAVGESKPSIDPIALCTQCHDPKHMKHPYGVAQKSGAEGLPLLPGRLIACHTCHDPHDVKKYRGGLRLEYVELCLKCHARHK
jgi:predicted CXXCH cytochrome family protein